jgi:recombinational DNA repair protein (RecF pathway)
MSEEKTVGLLLQAIPYLGNKKVLKVLSPEGLLTLMSGKKNLNLITTPFVWAEWVYQVKDKKELHSLHDGTLLDDLSRLKENYEGLITAGQMAQDLLKTQMPGKTAIEALTLTLACFRKLHLFTHPRVLLAAFRLKLLHCEGLIDECETPQFEALLLSRSFLQLAEFPKDDLFLDQIDRLFEERIDF